MMILSSSSSSHCLHTFLGCNNNDVITPGSSSDFVYCTYFHIVFSSRPEMIKTEHFLPEFFLRN